MDIYTDSMMTSTSGTTAAAAMTGSPYSPLQDGRLLGVIIVMSGQAASSLMETANVILTCPTFNPANSLNYYMAGGGLRTAPAFPIPPATFGINESVLSQQGIKGTLGWNVTAVTPNVSVTGVFQC
jgi:hypothetical protein